MNDLELLEGMLDNNHDAFRLFVEKYQSVVYRIAYNILNNQDDADDIAQDVFIEIYKNIGDFRSDSKITTWMYRIATNKSLNLLKKNKRKNFVQRLDAFFTADDDYNVQIIDEKAVHPNDNLEQVELQRILHNSINKLPDNQKVAYTLFNIDELAYKEIAEVMDISLSAVESLIHRAKKTLQKKLANYYHS